MTAERIARLRCDYPGCTAEYTAGHPSATITRSIAAGAHWHYRSIARQQAPARSEDLCPDHAPLLDNELLREGG